MHGTSVATTTAAAAANAVARRRLSSLFIWGSIAVHRAAIAKANERRSRKPKAPPVTKRKHTEDERRIIIYVSR